MTDQEQLQLPAHEALIALWGKPLEQGEVARLVLRIEALEMAVFVLAELLRRHGVDQAYFIEAAAGLQGHADVVVESLGIVDRAGGRDELARRIERLLVPSTDEPPEPAAPRPTFTVIPGGRD